MTVLLLFLMSYSFLLDYITVMGLFVFIGHYISEWLRRADRKNSSI